VVAAIAAALLAAGHLLTRDAIEAQQLEELRKSLSQVVPGADPRQRPAGRTA
jgi:Na+-translocating ferredoxin:NAD+ oxidoreductase RnfG subunit